MKGRKPKPIPSGTEQAPPPIPKDLHSPEARREWRRITAILARQRVLSEQDQAVLFIYATSYAQYKEAQAKIEEYGTVINSSTGTPVRNPYCTAQTAAWDRIKNLISELGLSPCARGRAGFQIEPDDKDGIEFF